MRWAAGDGGAAEEQFDTALALDGRWGSMRHVREATRWPPRLYQAMERFLAITKQGAGSEQVQGRLGFQRGLNPDGRWGKYQAMERFLAITKQGAGSKQVQGR